MTHFAAFLILLALTPLFIFVLHCVIIRVLRLFELRPTEQLTVLACAVIGHLPMGALLWVVHIRHVYTQAGGIYTIIYTLVVYNALAYSYFHVFNMSDTARRIRILYEIYTVNKIKVHTLTAKYGAKEMLDNRLERLLATRQIKLIGNRYVLDKKLIHDISLLIAWLGRLLGIPYPEAKHRADAKPK